MSDQLSLLDVRLEGAGHVRDEDPPTAHAAAAGVRRRSEILLGIEKALHAYPNGLTDWELLDALQLPERFKGSVAKRRHDLGARDSGRTRPSPFGTECIVWVLP